MKTWVSVELSPESKLHENRCPHKYRPELKFWRVVSADGCVANVCWDCFLPTSRSPGYCGDRAARMASPIDSKAWTQADVAANIGANC